MSSAGSERQLRARRGQFRALLAVGADQLYLNLLRAGEAFEQALEIQRLERPRIAAIELVACLDIAVAAVFLCGGMAVFVLVVIVLVAALVTGVSRTEQFAMQVLLADRAAGGRRQAEQRCRLLQLAPRLGNLRFVRRRQSGGVF